MDSFVYAEPSKCDRRYRSMTRKTETGGRIVKNIAENAVGRAEASDAKLIEETPLYLKAMAQCRIIDLYEMAGEMEGDVAIFRIL